MLWKPRKPVPSHHVDAILAHWIEGRLAAKGEPTSQRAAELANFAERVDEAVALAGVRELRDLPKHMLANLNALRAAVFGPDQEFEDTLLMIGPKQHQTLREIRASVQHMRVKAAPEITLYPEPAALPRSERMRQLADWLKAQAPDPDLWHEIALSSDPDGMDELFLWIVRQRQCDAATGAFLFHACNAFDALEALDPRCSTPSPAQFEVARTVAQRWQDNDFLTYRFRFPEMGYELSLERYREIETQARRRFGAAAFDVHPGLFEFKENGASPQSRWRYADL